MRGDAIRLATSRLSCSAIDSVCGVGTGSWRAVSFFNVSLPIHLAALLVEANSFRVFDCTLTHGCIARTACTKRQFSAFFPDPTQITRRSKKFMQAASHTAQFSKSRAHSSSTSDLTLSDRSVPSVRVQRGVCRSLASAELRARPWSLARVRELGEATVVIAAPGASRSRGTLIWRSHPPSDPHLVVVCTSQGASESFAQDHILTLSR
jgi:hypothetical protein